MPAASIAGGIIGNSEASGSEDAASGDLQQALQNYQNAQVPTTAEQQWNLAQEQSAGQLNPTTEGAVQMGPNAMDNISTNPAYAQAQMGALQQLQQLGQGGLTAQERQNLIQSQQAAAGTANSANGALQQQMAARGMGGSGLQLATALSSNQNAANQAAQNGNATNAMAQQNALGAMSQSGNLAGSMQAQQFGQQAAVAQAQNAINQFNAQNQQNVGNYNTQASNAAQAANLANQQNIANTNTGLQNQQQQHNTGLYQQQFNDQMAQAGGEAGVLGQQSQFNQQQAANTAAEWAGIGNGVNSMATSAFSAMAGMPSSGGSGNWSSGLGTSGSGGSGGASASNNFGAGNYFSGSTPPASSSGGGFNLGYAHGGKVEHVDGIQAVLGEIPPPNTFAQGGHVLDANARAHIASHNFALPGGRYPIEDPNHARNALSRVSQNGSPEEQAKVRAAVHNKFPSIGHADGGMINPPNYDDGGMIGHAAQLAPLVMLALSKGGKVPEHNGQNLDALQKAFGKFIGEEKKEKYAQGGEVSTLGMNSYYEGGNLTGLPHAPQKQTDGTDMNQSYSGGGDVIGLSGNAGQIPLPAKPHFDDGGTIPPKSYSDQYMQNMAALQRGANAIAVPVKAKPQFDPSKYPNRPDYTNAEDAAEGAEEQTAAEHPNGMAMPDDVQAALNKYQTYSHGGDVQAKVSPQERYYSPKQAEDVAEEKVPPKATGKVFSGKAPVKGDSPKNDIIDTKLQAGGIVIPRSVANKSDDDILNFVKKVREGKKK